VNTCLERIIKVHNKKSQTQKKAAWKGGLSGFGFVD